MSPCRRMLLVSLLALFAGSTVLILLHLSGWWELLLAPLSVGLGLVGAMHDEEAEP